MKKQKIWRPTEGSTYTFVSKDPNNAYNGYTGRVVYEPDGTFSLTDGKSWLIIGADRPIKRDTSPPNYNGLLTLLAPVGAGGIVVSTYAHIYQGVWFFALVTLVGGFFFGKLLRERLGKS